MSDRLPDITKGIYLRLTASHFGYPAGLIGTVHSFGTDWSGNWYFQLRWLNQVTGKRNRPVSEWSLNLRDKDLKDFERIASWEQVQELLRESRPQRKPRRKVNRRLRFSKPLKRVPRVKRHPNQLKLYEWD
jgi:hypothetical protein